MKDLRFFGKTFVAVAMIVFGLQHFVYLDFVTRAFAPLPNWIPAQAIFAIFFGSLLCATGIAIIANIKAHTMSLLLAGTILLMFALCLLPDLLTNLNNPMLWTNSGKALVLTGSNLIVAGSISTKSSKGPIKYLEFLIPLGKLFLAGFFALAATMHFLYADFVATLIPAWIPGHLFWTYFAAVALLAGALGMFIPKTEYLAASLSALMIFLWVIILHLPRAFADIHNANETTALFEALTMCGASILIAAKARKK